MAPHRCFRGVLKDSAVPIERLSEACFSEARPIDRAVLERSFHSGIGYMHRPGEHHEAVVGLDPGQARTAYWTDCWSQWTLTKFRAILRSQGYYRLQTARWPRCGDDASSSVEGQSLHRACRQAGFQVRFRPKTDLISIA